MPIPLLYLVQGPQQDTPVIYLVREPQQGHSQCYIMCREHDGPPPEVLYLEKLRIQLHLALSQMADGLRQFVMRWQTSCA